MTQSPNSRALLAVMAKAPRAGLVKTRMCPPFTPQIAAALYAQMLGDVLEASARMASERDLDAWLAVAPDDGLVEVARLAPPGFRLHRQRGPGLAQRMERVLVEAAAAGAELLLLRGSDSPALDARHLDAVLAALETDEVALCPDRDGGYSLVGLRTAAVAGRGLFEHPMSTQRVLEDTLTRAGELGLRASWTEACFDLDTVADLRELQALRERTALPHCRRTLAFLDRLALWPAAP